MADQAGFDETARHNATRRPLRKKWIPRVIEALVMVALVSAFYPW